MKSQIKFYSLFVIFTLLFSCPSDDAVPQTIVGDWILVSSNTTQFINGTQDYSEDFVVNQDNYSRLSFLADGTYIEFTSYTYTDINGDTVVDTDTDSGTYITNGNLLSISYDNGPDVFNIEYIISGNQLDTFFFEEYVFNGDVFREEYRASFIRD